MQVGFPHIQTVVKIWRESTAYKTDEKEICYYLSSEPFDRRTPEQQGFPFLRHKSFLKNKINFL
jgi:hypothetical protein